MWPDSVPQDEFLIIIRNTIGDVSDVVYATGETVKEKLKEIIADKVSCSYGEFANIKVYKVQEVNFSYNVEVSYDKGN